MLRVLHSLTPGSLTHKERKTEREPCALWSRGSKIVVDFAHARRFTIYCDGQPSRRKDRMVGQPSRVFLCLFVMCYYWKVIVAFYSCIACSLILRQLPVLQCCTLKSGKAWEAKSSACDCTITVLYLCIARFYTSLCKVIAQSKVCDFASQAFSVFSVQHWKTGNGLRTRLCCLHNHSIFPFWRWTIMVKFEHSK